MESCDETSDLATTRLDSDLIAVRSEPREFNPKSRRIHFRDTILDLLAKFLEIASSVQQALGVRRIAGVMQHHLPYLSNRSHAESARSIGNVRELRQVVARLCARHVGPPPISVGDLPPDERPREEPPGRAEDDTLIRWVRVALAADANLRDIRRAAEETAITIALEDANGNLHSASQRLKVTDRALQLRRAAARKTAATL